MVPVGILAPAAVLAAGVCWGFIGVFSLQLQNAGLSSVQVAMVRAVLTTLLLAVLLLVKDRALFAIRLRDIWMFIGMGTCSIAFFNVCYFACMAECSLSIAVMLLYTAPAMVTVLACLVFRERFTVRKLIALVLAFTGCACVVGLVTGDLQASPVGILLGLGSGLGYALYSIFGRIALQKYHPLTVCFYTFLVASISLAPFSNCPALVGAIGANAGLLVPMVLIAAISTLAPYLLYNFGLQHLETGRASIMTFSEPLVATLCGVLVFGDVLTPIGVLGIVLIAASIVVLNWKSDTLSPDTENTTTPKR